MPCRRAWVICRFVIHSSFVTRHSLFGSPVSATESKPVLTFALLGLALACAVAALGYWAALYLEPFAGLAESLRGLHAVTAGAVVAGFFLATAALVRRERWPLFVLLAAVLLGGAACLWWMSSFAGFSFSR